MTTPDPILSQRTDTRYPDTRASPIPVVVEDSCIPGPSIGDPITARHRPPVSTPRRVCGSARTDDGLALSEPDVWLVLRDGCVVDVAGSCREANLLADALLDAYPGQLVFVEVVCDAYPFSP